MNRRKFKVGETVLFKQTILDNGIQWAIGVINEILDTEVAGTPIYLIRWECNGMTYTARRYSVAIRTMIDDVDIDKMVEL